MYTSHLYEVSCFRYDMVPDGSSRATYETHIHEVRCRHSREARAETVNPETRDHGAGAPVFFHRATNSALAASRMSLATALAEPLGETDREYDPFFSSRTGQKDERFFLRSAPSRHHLSHCKKNRTVVSQLAPYKLTIKLILDNCQRTKIYHFALSRHKYNERIYILIQYRI